MTRRLSAALVCFAVAGAFGVPAAVDAAQPETQQQAQQQGQQQTPDPLSQPDDTWISLEGMVEAVESNGFRLDYGEGTVTIEMPTGMAEQEGLASGQAVIVSGMITDDLFRMTAIEAESVWVEPLGRFVFQTEDAREGRVPITVVPGQVVRARAVAQGTVTSVDDGVFTLNTGDQAIRVNTSELSYNPLDNQGYQRIRVGDRVRVTGAVAFQNPNRGRELFANQLFTLASGPMN